jgi:RNA polymerase sigma-70 factor (ECF subfamily)
MSARRPIEPWRVEAFEQGVFPQLDALFGLALHLTRDRADAEDLVQETCLRAYRHFNRFEQGTNLRAWLFTILRNGFVNQRKKARTRSNLRVALDADAAHHRFHASRRDPGWDGSVPFTRNEIQDALRRLPEEYRVTVILVGVNGLKYREVAQVMGCPLGTVMSRLFRARKMLRAMLEGRPRRTPETGEGRRVVCA